jgi:nitrite reductase/ring-hydroxylating ferredoxin subunit/uncharacterized membrane protein
MRPFDDIDRLAESPALDRVATPVRAAIHKMLPNRRLRDALHGVWLGHPLHPMLVQLPIGAFLSSAVLDLLPGQRRGADALIRLGLAASIPAATAGAVDYSDGLEEQQRLGVVHATSNSAALLCYLASLRMRSNGHRPAGIVAAWSGLLLIAAGGVLGGHMSYRQTMGANRVQHIPHVAPSEWSDLGTIEDLPARQPAKRMVGDIPVVVVRTGERVHVLADTCGHAGGPLHRGELIINDGSGELTCVQCPWHGSVFRLSDGAAVHGPATSPQPGFDSQVIGGHVQARVRMIPGVPAAG